MTTDDAIKGLVAILVAAAAWLTKRVLGDREELLVLKAEVKELKESRVTVEGVRKVIEEALDKRDKLAEQRREEWAKTRQLETKAVIQEELEKLVPRLAREIQGMNAGKAK